jgi:hypothetical protein
MDLVHPRYKVPRTSCNPLDNSFISATGAIELPRRFDELPRDLQILVLRRTAASFVVQFLDILSIERYDDIGLHKWSVPVIARYEFKLEPRLASWPEMSALFSRALDPQFKSDASWRSMDEEQQVYTEDAAGRQDTYESFSELGVGVCDYDPTKARLCFVRTGSTVFWSALWSRLPHRELSKFRDKLQKEFGMHLRDMSIDCGAPHTPPQGAWA